MFCLQTIVCSYTWCNYVATNTHTHTHCFNPLLLCLTYIISGFQALLVGYVKHRSLPVSPVPV